MTTDHTLPVSRPFVEIVDDGDELWPHLGQVVMATGVVDEGIGCVAGTFEEMPDICESSTRKSETAP